MFVVLFFKVPSKLGISCNSFNLRNILEINYSATRISMLAILTYLQHCTWKPIKCNIALKKMKIIGKGIKLLLFTSDTLVYREFF